MALTDYVKLEEIRSALGVSKDEISDGEVLLDMYEHALEADASEVGSSALVDYAVISDKERSARTAVEQTYFTLFHLYAIYTVAKLLTTSLPLFSPKTYGDGKALMTRYSDSPYKSTIADVRLNYSKYRKDSIIAYAEFQGSSEAAFTPFIAVQAGVPTSDPVTGT